MRNILIKDIGIYIPKNEIGNEYFIEHFRSLGMECESLMKHMNRDKRFLADRYESSLSMGYEAAINALNKAKISAEELDMIVFVSDTPEYNSPTNALKLNHMLKATNAHRVFDMNCNCTGMLVALDNISTYAKHYEDVNKILIVGCIHISSVVDYKDTVAYPNMGDAAAAIILESCNEENERGVLSSTYITDSSYEKFITLPACGHSRELIDKLPRDARRLSWQPFKLDFLAKDWTLIINQLMERHNITIDDVSYFCFSQFSHKDNLKTLENLEADLDKYIFVGNKYGYTGCSSPILALNEIWDKKKETGYIIFCSVAAGCSMNAVLYKI